MFKQLVQQTSNTIAAYTDHVFVEWVLKGQVPGRTPRPYMREDEALRYIDRIEAASDFYAQVSDLEAYPEPGLPVDLRRQSAGRWRSSERMTWTSAYQVLRQEIAPKYHTKANDTVHVARFGSGSERAVVCVHGYMGGHLDMESKIWPVDLFLDHGFDVFLITLPHHGPRMTSVLQKPLFPEKATLTVEGMCQSVFDLRTLVSVLKSEGYEHVGVSGMSLGGYVVSLCLGVESRLSWCVPMIPLTDFAQMSQDFNALAGEVSATQSRHKEAISSLCQLIDPLSRPPKLDAKHAMVMAGRFDGVLSQTQSQALASHIGCPLVHFEGGHLVQRGRRAALEGAMEMAKRACAL